MFMKAYSSPSGYSNATMIEYDVRAAKVARFTRFENGGPGPYGYLQGGAIAYRDYGSSFKFTNAATGAQLDSIRGYYPYYIDETNMRVYGQLSQGTGYVYCLQLGPLSSIPSSKESSGIVVVPNPSRNDLSVQGLSACVSVHIMMSTISGETVFDVNVPVREGVAYIAPMLPPGTYALRATTNLGMSFSTVLTIVK